MPMMWLTIIPCFLLSFHISQLRASARLFNVSVDDRYGAFPRKGTEGITIRFSGGWDDHDFEDCRADRGCLRSPDLRQSIMNGTWKGSIFDAKDTFQKEPSTATLTFNGTAIYVNCLLSRRTASGTPGNTEIAFIIDDSPPVYIVQPPPASDEYTTIYQRTNLTIGRHDLLIQNGRQNGVFDEAVIFLDSIVYTADDGLDQDRIANPATSDSGLFEQPTSTTPPPQATDSERVNQRPFRRRHSPEVAAVLAGLFGGLVGLATVSFIVWYSRRKIINASILRRSKDTRPAPFSGFAVDSNERSNITERRDKTQLQSPPPQLPPPQLPPPLRLADSGTDSYLGIRPPSYYSHSSNLV